ncbi:rRNA pseudouridine synthase [bacterium]|nr:rRNA pseudouridine synthase [bacterium]
MRLQSFLAQAGVTSRRKAETLISAGKVKVNGEIVTKLGLNIDPATDKIELIEKSTPRTLEIQNKKLYLFHKPRGIITAMSDPRGAKCVGDLVKNFKTRLFPVGRLDRDVSGLLLLTNNGDFAEQLAHPRYSINRIYWAKVSGKLDRDKRSQLLNGVNIALKKSNFKACAKAVHDLQPSPRALELLGKCSSAESYLEITVAEGSKHFVKKILKSVGLPVQALSRISFGKFSLGNLPVGEIIDISVDLERSN